MSARKIERWHAAGVIDAATRSRLLAYEADNSRPLALWAVVGIGALAVGLGIVSVVAANWDAVPGTVRLSLHLVLVASVAALIAVRGDKMERDSPWALEAALFVFGMLGLAYFGHVGQVYQTDSPLWRPLAAWLLLFVPVLLLRGQSWIVALGLMAAVIGTAWEYVSMLADWTSTIEPGVPWLWMSFVTALPVLVAPLAAWLKQRSSRIAFWTRMEQLAIAYALVSATLICAIASVGEVERGIMSIGPQVLRATVALLGAGLVGIVHRLHSGKAAATILGACGISILLASLFNDFDVLAGLLFMALWAAVGGAALYAGWREVFQLAVAAVALRLIVLSFELASDLLTSGFGLIVAGLMILGVAWVAVKVSRTFAPPKRDGGEDAA